jgi:hypothetical protein
MFSWRRAELNTGTAFKLYTGNAAYCARDSQATGVKEDGTHSYCCPL